MTSSPSLLTNPEEFQAWKDQPATREFLNYLRDRQSDLMQAWGEGRTNSAEHQAQAVLLGRLAQIKCEDIHEQYRPNHDDAGALAERLKEEAGL